MFLLLVSRAVYLGTRKNLILEQRLSHNPSAIPEIISRLRAFWGFFRVPTCRKRQPRQNLLDNAGVPF